MSFVEPPPLFTSEEDPLKDVASCEVPILEYFLNDNGDTDMPKLISFLQQFQYQQDLNKQVSMFRDWYISRYAEMKLYVEKERAAYQRDVEEKLDRKEEKKRKSDRRVQGVETDVQRKKRIEEESKLEKKRQKRKAEAAAAALLDDDEEENGPKRKKQKGDKKEKKKATALERSGLKPINLEGKGVFAMPIFTEFHRRGYEKTPFIQVSMNFKPGTATSDTASVNDTYFLGHFYPEWFNRQDLLDNEEDRRVLAHMFFQKYFLSQRYKTLSASLNGPLTQSAPLGKGKSLFTPNGSTIQPSSRVWIVGDNYSRETIGKVRPRLRQWFKNNAVTDDKHFDYTSYSDEHKENLIDKYDLRDMFSYPSGKFPTPPILPRGNDAMYSDITNTIYVTPAYRDPPKSSKDRDQITSQVNLWMVGLVKSGLKIERIVLIHENDEEEEQAFIPTDDIESPTIFGKATFKKIIKEIEDDDDIASGIHKKSDKELKKEAKAKSIKRRLTKEAKVLAKKTKKEGGLIAGKPL